MDIDVKKREWVKTAAIVFLIVMLLLTFFSNTIMNRSLPEVAAQYTQSATITSRIRGSGTVRANESFEVKTSQTYEVSSVPVKVGDMVETGDVLLVLSKDGSIDLEQTRKELQEAELQLEIKLIQSPNTPLGDAHRHVQSMKSALSAAEDELSLARRKLDQAKRERNAINFDYNAYQKEEAKITDARNKMNAARVAMDNAQSIFDLYCEEKNYLMTPPAPGTDPEYDAKFNDLLNKKEAYLIAKNTYDMAVVNANIDSLDAWEAANAKVDVAESEVRSREEGVRNAENSLASANDALSQAQRAAGIESSLYNIEVRELQSKIDALQEKLEELEETGSISEITAPVSGKITQANIRAGDSTIPDSPLMVIEMVDRGYTLSIPVTAEQSARVNIGDMADVDRGWWSWGEPLTAVLTNIRPDPQNPSGGRLLVFSISGENVESETQLNVTIAQRSENYGIVVPKSAIRTDSNGDFVLVVETRSSPLRNRYVAVRVNVTILASDDVNSAVSGAGLSGWDFVITTSTRPIEPGMQVRLVDN